MADHPPLEVQLLLRAARETGALEALMTSAETPAELTDQTDLTARGAELLVSALTLEGFLEYVDGSYEPTNRSLGFLAKRDVRSIGTLPVRLDRLERGETLARTLETDDPPAMTTREQRNQLGNAAAVDGATVRAVVTALENLHPEGDAALIIRGAPGRYARELRVRGLECTILDSSERLQAAEALLGPADITCVEGSVTSGLTTALEASPVGPHERFDLIVAIDCCFRFGSDVIERLIADGGAHLAPGGWLAIIERLEQPAVVTTEALLETSAGRCYAVEQYHEWFETTGLTNEMSRRIPSTPYHLVGAQQLPE